MDVVVSAHWLSSSLLHAVLVSVRKFCRLYCRWMIGGVVWVW